MFFYSKLIKISLQIQHVFSFLTQSIKKIPKKHYNVKLSIETIFFNLKRIMNLWDFKKGSQFHKKISSSIVVKIL